MLCYLEWHLNLFQFKKSVFINSRAPAISWLNSFFFRYRCCRMYCNVHDHPFFLIRSKTLLRYSFHVIKIKYFLRKPSS
jgi:hypothetical protein